MQLKKKKKKEMKLDKRQRLLHKIELDLYLEGRLGLIMDGTARDYNKISGQQRLFKLLGYQTIMMFINTSLDVALERNANRQRSVPENIVKTSWE